MIWRPFNKRFLLIPAILAALLVFLLLQKNTKEEIQSQLEELRALAEVKGREPPFENLTKVQTIVRHIAHDFSVVLPDGRVLTFPDRKTMVQKFAAARAELSSLELSLKFRLIEVAGTNARVELTGSALGAMPGAEGKFLEIHTVNLDLSHKGGYWLLKKAVHIRNERAPADQQRSLSGGNFHP